MKKITLLLGLLLISLNNYAQQDISELDALLERYDVLPPDAGIPTDYFSLEEIALLQSYLASQSQEDIATENAAGGGAVIYGTDPADSGSLITFNVDTPENLNFIGPNSSSADVEVAGDIDPTNLQRAYAITINLGEFYEIDLATATYTLLGTIPPPSGTTAWTGLEFDPTNNILYGISLNVNVNSIVSVIDIPNLTATPIGFTGIMGAISLTTDGNGNFYSHDLLTDSLFSIDINTGTGTSIGPLGFNASFAQDMEWDPISQTMYMAAFNVDNMRGELRTVNLSTGQTTFLGLINPTANFGSITWASIPTDATLSTENVESVNFNIYPNPAQNNINITSDNLIEDIVIYNLLGEKVFQKSIETTDTNLLIDSLQAGIYFLQASFSNQIITKRFVKN